MDEQNNTPVPWDDGVYGTGSTEPPKSRSGALAVLLILVIFLSGIITVLSVLNIQMFRKLRTQEAEEVAFSLEEDLQATEPTVPFSEPSETAPSPAEDVDLNLQQAPTESTSEFEGGMLSLQEIYEQSIPSVVSILCRSNRSESTGTGVILSDRGYIVTNNHVISGASQIEVLLTDGSTYMARVVGADSVSDLAVLYIDAENLVSARFGSSDQIRVGDSVVAIGDPLGIQFRGTMTDGIISAINRDVTVGGRTLNLLQTNAALNSGNSGGPLINRYGQVIGINTMKIGAFTDNAGVEGIGFAIPSGTVKEIVEQIIDKGYVSGRPWLGIQGESLSAFYQRFYRMPAGLYINTVEPGSPAALVGIEPGDILLNIDGTRISTSDELTALLYSRKVGDELELTIYRRGYQASVTLTLAEAVG